jgi:hypothetical protein
MTASASPARPGSAHVPCRTLGALGGAAAIAVLLGLAGGCGGPDRISGERLERLKEGLREAKAGPIRLEAVLPRTLAEGVTRSTVIMPFVSHGTVAAEFPLYDGYFKVAFASVDELRSLGLEARIDPRLWAERLEAVGDHVRAATSLESYAASERTIDLMLAELHAQEEIQALWRLDPAQKRNLLVSRMMLLAARSALAPERRAKAPTARDIREMYFSPDGAPRAPLTLAIEVLDISASAEESTASSETTGRASLRLSLRGRDGTPIAEGAHACALAAEGTGVVRDKTGTRWQATLRSEDPLERAIRGAVCEFMEAALPGLEAAR